ncbi:beta-eliminating lyase-related protein [Lentzea sp. BCCO 10_0856]|uniref:Beta-eliminating lyase-related protein n=1 Tax=Lentzea miocenica TaxID=3095431 RepID=A0ABU4SWQ3_9PSEU|nr:beta-eliminating lyase-related protein [Lentzea sp. BCCO 10_0856]MDX8030321.1 beta-eliminating lyase-related protein [Lentzea sp. BCCO 10_0856]
MDVLRSLSSYAGPRRSPHEVLRRLTEWMTPEVGPEDPVRLLEERVAGLLGKQRALFFPSGTMAQQSALRVHAERTGRHAFAGHPQTHLHVWENQGYSAVHGLRFHPAGDRHALLTLDDLKSVGEPLAAVVIELPQRDIGGRLPAFEDLQAQTRWAREQGAAAHCDGARLWEAQTGYDASLAEIAGLFDTVYVSLYKGLEGARGAVLAGDAETIEHAAVWRRRLGGAIVDAWPLAAIALMGMDENLPRMREFRAHARALAKAINDDGFAHTTPEVPATPLFHVHLPMSKQDAEQAARKLVEDTGIKLFLYARSNPDPRRCAFEVSVGISGLDFAPREVAELIRGLPSRV